MGLRRFFRRDRRGRFASNGVNVPIGGSLSNFRVNPKAKHGAEAREVAAIRYGPAAQYRKHKAAKRKKYPTAYGYGKHALPSGGPKIGPVKKKRKRTPLPKLAPMSSSSSRRMPSRKRRGAR